VEVEVLGACLVHLVDEENGAAKVEVEVLEACLAHLVDEESGIGKAEVLGTHLARLVEENSRNHLDNHEADCLRLNLSNTRKHKFKWKKNTRLSSRRAGWDCESLTCLRKR